MNLDITILEKLKGLLSTVRRLDHQISLFTIIQREDFDTWDLVFAGDNLRTKENMEAILKLTKKMFEEEEILKFPRLILLDSDNVFAKNINKAFAMEGGAIRLQNSQIDDVFIRDAYLLHSKHMPMYSKKGEKNRKVDRGVKIKDSTTSASGKININKLTKNNDQE